MGMRKGNLLSFENIEAAAAEKSITIIQNDGGKDARIDEAHTYMK